DSLMSRYTAFNTELVDINDMRKEKQQLPFIKMQGTSNDYIYIDCFKNRVASPEFLSIYLSDRANGVGGDGVILICPSAVADAKMLMYNRDGSEGKMCGNGIRCVAKYIYDCGISKNRMLRIETASGIKNCEVFTKMGVVFKVRVDMGKAEFNAAQIPVKLDGDLIVNRELDVDGILYSVTCMSMGNPHCVVFNNSVDKLDLITVGPKFEQHEVFPEGVNTEFVEIVDENTIKMRVWERGIGETLACGTGACAAAVAAVLNGYCKKGEDIRVILKGGDLVVNYSNTAVLMTGNAVKVFDGVVEI
ncbi:MAG: diaminopimelate epimerase, partial [Oscillospiraceae bacterium]